MTPSENTNAAADAVTIHAVGVLALSCCAPKGMSREVVEARCNVMHPTGIERRWIIVDRGGRFPVECDCDATRQHWLLRC